MSIIAKNVVYKLLGFGSVLWLGKRLYPGVHLPASAIMATDAALTSVGTIADQVIVPRLGNLPSLTLGLPGMTGIIWGTAKIWPKSNLSLVRAATLALLAAPIEYALHGMVLRNLGGLSTDRR